MKELQAVVACVAGGAVIGKALGIGPAGTLLGAAAGAFLGYRLAAPTDTGRGTWVDLMPDGPL